jgi:hypothetical protein
MNVLMKLTPQVEIESLGGLLSYSVTALAWASSFFTSHLANTLFSLSIIHRRPHGRQNNSM